MQLPQAYRSLPRPSSKPKPSYPSNSINSSIIPSKNFIQIKLILTNSIKIQTKWDFLQTSFIVLRAEARHGSLWDIKQFYCFMYSSAYFIEYKTTFVAILNMIQYICYCTISQ